MATRKPAGGKAAIAAAEKRMVRLLEPIYAEIDQRTAKAQRLAFDAMEARSDATALARITKALAASPLCADAWGMLAGSAPPGTALALDLWRQSVAAGSLALGPHRFAEFAGEFWGWHETRPYMRARAGLAQELRRHGQPAAAVAEVQAMLELNPNDNQGMRYLLLDWLLADGRDAEAAALHDRYRDDGAAAWAYGAALLAFRREGAGAASPALQAALENNPHVPALLLGRIDPPEERPPFYSPGDASEAVIYAEDALPAWRATPGALDWLAGAAGEALPAKPRRGRKPRVAS